LGLQAIEDDLHALGGDGGGLQVQAQLTDFRDEGLKCLGVWRRGLSGGGGREDQGESCAKHMVIVQSELDSRSLAAVS
jgi:hypothetical protein